MADDQRADLQREVNLWHRRFDWGCRAWSAAHHLALLVAALSSAGAAMLLKISYFKATFGTSTVTDVSALLAAVGTLVTAVTAFAGFERKWRANRLSRGRMNQLRIDLMDPAADLAAIRSGLKAVLEAEDREVLGISPSPT